MPFPTLPEAGAVKTNLALAQLDQGARRMNDTECANRMASAKSKLLRIILYWKRILISGSFFGGKMPRRLDDA